MSTSPLSFQDRLLAVARNAMAGDPVSAYDPTKPQMVPGPSAPPTPVMGDLIQRGPAPSPVLIPNYDPRNPGKMVPLSSSPKSDPGVSMPEITPPSPSDVVPPQSAPDAVKYPETPTADETPKLAQQGPKNRFLNLLSQLAGQSGDQPKPGDPYTGPVTTSDKIAGAMRLAGRIGNGLAAAAGTPEQQQLAEKRAEFGPELQATTALKKAQIESNDLYHRGQIAVGHEKNDVASDKNVVTQQKQALAARLKGYVHDPSDPSGFRPMTPDEILADPILSQNRDIAQAGIMLKHAESQKALADFDVKMNPNNPTFLQKQKQIDQMYEMAKARFSLQRERLGVTEQNSQMRGLVNMWQFGQNPLTGEKLTPENAPSPAMYEDEGGNVVPTRQQSAYTPSGSMKTQEQMSKTIQPMVPKITSQVQTLASKIGPGAGRWQQFWVNKGGVNDPAFAGLNTDLSLFATALGKAHFGSKIPAGFVDDMMRQFGTAQSPDDLVSRINHADVWVNGYAAAHPNTVGNTGGGQPAPKATPQNAAPKPAKSNDPMALR